MLGFIDTMRAEGHAVESICRVLREQDCQIAARTYRAWKRGVVSSRTVTDAQVADAVREAAWTTVEVAGRQLRKLTPEGLYGRRKMTALIRRSVIAGASRGAVDRAMRVLGLAGIRRDKGTRTTIPAKDGIRAGDLLNSGGHRTAARSHLGDGLHLLPHVGGVGLCRVHRQRVLTTHRRVARADHQTRRTGLPRVQLTRWVSGFTRR
jgi:hypothetical protein